MVNIRKHAHQHQTFILIAPGFEERFVVYCLCSIREKGTPVWLVGLTTKLVHGLRGLVIQPDFPLTQLEELIPFQTSHQLILPGEQECAALLLSDPRVHRLVTAVVDAKGYVMTTTPSEQALLRTNHSPFQTPAHLLTQDGAETVEYVQQLTRFISAERNH